MYSDNADFYIGQTGVDSSTVQDTWIRCFDNGSVSLFYSNSKKLETISTGIYLEGEILASNNITAYYSDARLKNVTEYLNPIESLNNVCSWNKVRYTANELAHELGGYDTNKSEIGLLAGEIEDQYPELAPAAPFDLDSNGNSISGDNYKTLQYERIVAIQASAIEGLNNKINEQEKRLARLEKLLS